MKLRIIDDLNPEDLAMLQALYSRSPESVDAHLEKVKASGSGKFMSRFYVGYGHKSIADCGSTTAFIEGVSLLAAKAIQDWPLYSGQETSTRYIDMSAQPIVNPFETHDSTEILAHWMSFYETKRQAVWDHVAQTHSKKPNEDGAAYERAVTARTFDIMRGFLPAGITTQLSWHTNLRQAGDHLGWMRKHPLREVQTIALNLANDLNTRYPSSGFDDAMAGVSGISNSGEDAARVRNGWEQAVARAFSYSTDSSFSKASIVYWSKELRSTQHVKELLSTRPRGCVLPHFLTDLGQHTAEFVLDFGSFRDLQRHRNGVVRMPLLGTSIGFEPWYLEQLPPRVREHAVELIDRQRLRIADLPFDVEARQYYVALGFRVPCQITMGLPALLYFMELRSQKTVHPTLRARVLQLAKTFAVGYPDIALHVDHDPDDWTIRRGNQTITER